jgi:hypothetical protein
MFGMKTKDTTMDMNPLACEIERLRTSLSVPRKPSGLQLAEHNMRKLRTDRAAHAELVRAAQSEDIKAGKSKSSPETAALTADLIVLDEEVRRARLTVAAERAKFAPTFLEHVGPRAVAAEQVINDLVTLLDDAVKVVVDVRNFAEANTLPSPAVIQRAHLLHLAVHEFRRLMAGGC